METLQDGLDALDGQQVKAEPETAELTAYQHELEVWFPLLQFEFPGVTGKTCRSRGLDDHAGQDPKEAAT